MVAYSVALFTLVLCVLRYYFILMSLLRLLWGLVCFLWVFEFVWVLRVVALCVCRFDSLCLFLFVICYYFDVIDGWVGVSLGCFSGCG